MLLRKSERAFSVACQLGLDILICKYEMRFSNLYKQMFIFFRQNVVKCF